MKKVILYIRLNVLYIFRNRMRIVLSLIGISIGLFVYLVGNTAVDSYINSMYKEVYSFDTNSFWIYDDSQKIINKLKKQNLNLDINKCSFLGEAYSSCNSNYIYNGIEVENAINLVGLNYSISNLAIPYIGTSDIMLAKSTFIFGRDFSEQDIVMAENYAVIEQSTAIYLFQKANAVGEYIDVVSPYGYNRFEIIGIIEDLPSTYSNNLAFNRNIKQKTQKKYTNILTVYTTYNYLDYMVGNELLQERYVVNVKEQEITGTMDQVVDALNEMATVYNIDAKIVSKSTMVNDIKALENIVNIFLNIVVLIIILVSGFIIVTIYIFAVKERTYEIGVRRALGASEFDIVSQFIIEGLITASLAGVITLFVSVICCNLATTYFIRIWYMDVRLVINKYSIFSMFGVAILEGIIFCFVPALIASKIRPSEAIRWD